MYYRYQYDNAGLNKYIIPHLENLPSKSDRFQSGNTIVGQVGRLALLQQPILSPLDLDPWSQLAIPAGYQTVALVGLVLDQQIEHVLPLRVATLGRTATVAMGRVEGAKSGGMAVVIVGGVLVVTMGVRIGIRMMIVGQANGGNVEGRNIHFGGGGSRKGRLGCRGRRGDGTVRGPGGGTGICGAVVYTGSLAG